MTKSGRARFAVAIASMLMVWQYTPYQRKAKTDVENLSSVWKSVGVGLRTAMNKFG